MVSIIGIYTTKLIEENKRQKLPHGLKLSEMSQSEHNMLAQNKTSFEEFNAYSKPIHITVEHGKRRDIGYVKTMWYDKDNNPYIEAEIVDKEIAKKVKANFYTGLSLKGSREVNPGGVVDPMDIEEISLVEKPFFDGCKITYCGSANINKNGSKNKNQNKSKKNIFSQNKTIKTNNRREIVFTIASLIMENSKEKQQVGNGNVNSNNSSGSSNGNGTGGDNMEEVDDRITMSKNDHASMMKELKASRDEKKKILKEYATLGDKEYLSDWKGLDKAGVFMDPTVIDVFRKSYMLKNGAPIKKALRSISGILRKRKSPGGPSNGMIPLSKRRRLQTPKTFTRHISTEASYNSTDVNSSTYESEKKDESDKNDLYSTLMSGDPLESFC